MTGWVTMRPLPAEPFLRHSILPNLHAQRVYSGPWVVAAPPAATLGYGFASRSHDEVLQTQETWIRCGKTRRCECDVVMVRHILLIERRKTLAANSLAITRGLNRMAVDTSPETDTIPIHANRTPQA
jgi:hypothetical protein